VVVAHGRERQDQLDIGPQLRLVLFDEHDLIAALVDNRLRAMALGQEGVHGDNTAFQDQGLYDGLDGRDLMGCVVNSGLGAGDAHGVRPGRQQVRPRRALVFRPSQRFPSQGYRRGRALKP
jgi:hypothetical protein